MAGVGGGGGRAGIGCILLADKIMVEITNMSTFEISEYL